MKEKETNKDDDLDKDKGKKGGLGRKRVFKKLDETGALKYHLGNILPLLVEE